MLFLVPLNPSAASEPSPIIPCVASSPNEVMEELEDKSEAPSANNLTSDPT